jgi:hemerythrin-like domain-containing protein
MKNIKGNEIVKLLMSHHRVIHTLNALRPIKEKLANWTDFLDYAKNKRIVDKILNYYKK